MEAESIPVWNDPQSLAAVDMDCDWCGASVSLNSGEFCGVCIDCGMVMFRERTAPGAGEPGPDKRPAASSSGYRPVTASIPQL